MAVRAPPRFQSPVYRGGCCNGRGDSSGPTLRSHLGFNPLFIGADAATWKVMVSTVVEEMLQRVSIPCLSGRMLQRTSTAHPRPCPTVSIPCLSGRMLQLAELGAITTWKAYPFRRACFNPLFIGADAATERARIAEGSRHSGARVSIPCLSGRMLQPGQRKWHESAAAFKAVSIPCLSGRMLQPAPSREPTTDDNDSCFNPLFIGADAVTDVLHLRSAWGRIPGFNPLFIGADAATPPTLGVKAPSPTRRFNPLFIGADAATTAASAGCDEFSSDLRCGFNPLFIGADAATWAYGGALAFELELLPVSIPCLSGRMLQP